MRNLIAGDEAHLFVRLPKKELNKVATRVDDLRAKGTLYNEGLADLGRLFDGDITLETSWAIKAKNGYLIFIDNKFESWVEEAPAEMRIVNNLGEDYSDRTGREAWIQRSNPKECEICRRLASGEMPRDLRVALDRELKARRAAVKGRW